MNRRPLQAGLRILLPAWGSGARCITTRRVWGVGCGVWGVGCGVWEAACRLSTLRWHLAPGPGCDTLVTPLSRVLATLKHSDT